ncbi:reverse transcriptase domain-containing protein [Tanacetum coccineum]
MREFIYCKVKGVETRRGKTTTQDAQNNDTNIHNEEPLVANHNEPVESNEVLTNNQPRKTNEPIVQPSIKIQTPPIPFPYRLRKEKEEDHQKKFLETLKQLHINFPFIEALAQMPKYIKFLKGLLTNRARLEEACTITMNERGSAVLLNKLPSKEKDPGSFTIPYDIGQLYINNALADLGASISLIPYTMYEKLGLGEPKATRMSLELADRSIQYPRGIIKDVLIKVDKFVLPIDFIILDMPEDSRVPINLGRPFLATARAMIDVFNKKITLRVGDDEVIFNVDQSIKRPPSEDDECYSIDDLDDMISTEAQELLANKEPDSFLSRGLEKSIDQSDLEGFEPVESEPVEMEREHLYSASANKIDEKKPELKYLPHHLEYAYLYGFFQIPIAPEDQEKTTFTCSYGTFAYLRMPFGLCNAPATFQRCMMEIFHDMVEDFMEVFMDDFSVFGCQTKANKVGSTSSRFNIEINDKRGAENLVVDHLSRLENPDLGTFTEEDIGNKFPDEHLMALKTELNNDEP